MTSETIRRFGKIEFGDFHWACPLHGVVYPRIPLPPKDWMDLQSTKDVEKLAAWRVGIVGKYASGVVQHEPRDWVFLKATTLPSLGFSTYEGINKKLIGQQKFVNLAIKKQYPEPYNTLVVWDNLASGGSPDLPIKLIPKFGHVIVSFLSYSSVSAIRSCPKFLNRELSAHFTHDGVVEYLEKLGLSLVSQFYDKDSGLPSREGYQTLVFRKRQEGKPNWG